MKETHEMKRGLAKGRPIGFALIALLAVTATAASVPTASAASCNMNIPNELVASSEGDRCFCGYHDGDVGCWACDYAVGETNCNLYD